MSHATATLVSKAILEVPCPECLSEPTFPCMDEEAVALLEPHYERVEAWQAAQLVRPARKVAVVRKVSALDRLTALAEAKKQPLTITFSGQRSEPWLISSPLFPRENGEAGIMVMYGATLEAAAEKCLKA